MRFVYLLIVLGFPLLDLYATVRVARWTHVPTWAWLGLPLIAGCLLLRNERIAFRARTIAAMHGEQAMLRGLLDSGRKVVAGFLLMLPGVISDVMALVLLALPLNVGGGERVAQVVGVGRGHGARRAPLDGEYHRVD